ncbi:spermatogenesis- and oogenesis-specific basic helix-loop-helix-containing protein 1 isoform X2 [Peromyscus californicus insignis]|uniref:spermatogenesis- and oogenesis-specific basic helix-loop-helix-containing protein 1 isoform X2 n=1 Tax=Peromyscus californicus insignis TaxID=564181 RepID=UPI0022A75C3A|nr:spermatogenesis- and oogenesis-specific basic helix-loop-helix-containing protein 1 isoform X2 [Peromyscus californicus insignis]
MASSGQERTSEDCGVSGITGCSKTPQPETRDSLPTPSQGSGPRAVPVAAANCGSCLRRNVISERERRRRISLSCERLRALLPQFDGRREDMASVLEMTVYFLQLAHSMAPGWEQLSVPQPSQEMWHLWQGDVVQVTLADQSADSKPDSGIAKASGAARVQDPPCCEMLSMDQSQALGRVSELLERPSSPLGKPQSPLSHFLPGSVEGRGGSALATSSPMDRAEPSFMGDPEPSSPELQPSPVELWGLDFGSPGLALQDEADSLFPDFFPRV